MRLPALRSRLLLLAFGSMVPLLALSLSLAVLLFAVLAGVRALTRRVDWYRVGASMAQRVTEPLPAARPKSVAP